MMTNRFGFPEYQKVEVPKELPTGVYIALIIFSVLAFGIFVVITVGA